MAHLYIANTTKQHHKFLYKVPGRSMPLEQDIPVGRQIKLGGLNHEGWPTKTIEAVIKHHANYGMIHVSEVDKASGFCGLVYSEQPIVLDNIMRLVEHNVQVLEEQGDMARQDAAVATAFDLAQKTGTSPADFKLDMSIREDTPNAQRSTKGDIQQSLEVTADPTKLQEAENQGRTIITPMPNGERKRNRRA